MKNKTALLAILCIAILSFSLSCPMTTMAQRLRKDIKVKEKKKQPEKKPETKKEEPKSAATSTANTTSGLNFWQPEIGLYFTLPLALTTPLSDLFGMGFGGHLYSTVRLTGFLPWRMPVNVRAGLLAGYATFSGADGDFTADSTRMSFILFGEVDYQLRMTSFNTRFFGRYGQGLSLTAASSSYPKKTGETVSTSVSSADSTILLGGGLGFNMRAIPKVEFQLAVNMLYVMQTLSGAFLDINIGVAYRFNEWK